MIISNFIGFGNEPYTSPEGVVICLKGLNKRVKIFFVDGDGKPANPYSVYVKVIDESERVLLEGDLVSGIVKKESDGCYYVNLVDSDYNLSSYAPKFLTFTWLYKELEDSEELYAVSNVYVISNKVYNWFPRLRNEIDKSRKLLNANIGFSDGNLYFYLRGGLDEINTFPPVTSFILDNFPDRYGQLIIDSSTVVALFSQSLYAVDTDVPSYSDQGFSFSTDHFSRLQSVLNTLLSKIKDQLRIFKIEFSSIGSINVQVVPYYPLAVMLKTAPTGSIFRHFFVS